MHVWLSFNPESAPRLTVSSRVIRLVKGSRQPSGTNVFGGIHVAVVIGLTSRAVSRPNRKRLALGDVSAFRATLRRRKPAVDFNYSAPSLFCFVLNHTDERGPTSVADRSRQISVLLHSLHVQALQSDDLVLVNNSSRELVKKIFSFVLNLCVDSRHALFFASSSFPIPSPFEKGVSAPCGGGRGRLPDTWDCPT